MRRVAIALLLFAPIICSCVEYPVIGKDGRTWIVPDDYRVDPDLYPKYRAIRDFQPPSLLPNPHDEPYLRKPRITRNDIWEVRHRVNDELWIYSESYNNRGGGDAEIAIRSDGRALPGWRGIADPKHILLRGDRAIPLKAPHYLEWGNVPLFETIGEPEK
jgi:hypothetical protein